MSYLKLQFYILAVGNLQTIWRNPAVVLDGKTANKFNGNGIAECRIKYIVDDANVFVTDVYVGASRVVDYNWEGIAASRTIFEAVSFDKHIVYATGFKPISHQIGYQNSVDLFKFVASNDLCGRAGNT